MLPLLFETQSCMSFFESARRVPFGSFQRAKLLLVAAVDAKKNNRSNNFIQQIAANPSEISTTVSREVHGVSAGGSCIVNYLCSGRTCGVVGGKKLSFVLEMYRSAFMNDLYS